MKFYHFGLILVLLISGCSVTTLECGVNEDESYVRVVNVPQELNRDAREYAELCGFAYEVQYAKP